MYRYGFTATITSIAVVASIGTLLLSMLGGDYSDICGGVRGSVRCVVDYHEDYRQLSASAIAAAATLAVAFLVFFTLRANSRTSGSAPNPAQSTGLAEVPISKRTTEPYEPLLRDYRRRIDDSSLNNKPWMKLVEGCVEIFDELDQNRSGFDPAGRELADHVTSRFEEILRRSGVEVISGEAVFDRGRHAPVRARSTDPGATVAETLSPGFAVGSRVLRRARVLLESSTGGR